MALKISGDTSSYEALPVGKHLAVCYRIVDAGTREEQWGDNPPKPRTLIYVTWEVPEQKMADGRPYSISRTYTASLNENATLYKDLVTWRGEPFTKEELELFDVSNMIGAPATLHVEHTDEGRAKIAGVFKPDEFKKTATINDSLVFDLSTYCDEFNGNSSAATKAMCDVFDSLREWQQEKIEDSFQLKAAKEKGGTKEETSTKGLADLANEADKDEVPFWKDKIDFRGWLLQSSRLYTSKGHPRSFKDIGYKKGFGKKKWKTNSSKTMKPWSKP